MTHYITSNTISWYLYVHYATLHLHYVALYFICICICTCTCIRVCIASTGYVKTPSPRCHGPHSPVGKIPHRIVDPKPYYILHKTHILHITHDIPHIHTLYLHCAIHLLTHLLPIFINTIILQHCTVLYITAQYCTV